MRHLCIHYKYFTFLSKRLQWISGKGIKLVSITAQLPSRIMTKEKQFTTMGTNNLFRRRITSLLPLTEEISMGTLKLIVKTQRVLLHTRQPGNEVMPLVEDNFNVK